MRFVPRALALTGQTRKLVLVLILRQKARGRCGRNDIFVGRFEDKEERLVLLVVVVVVLAAAVVLASCWSPQSTSKPSGARHAAGFAPCAMATTVAAELPI